ncbi:MAG: ABC transporter substrate-binding protein [Fusobacterium sp.]|uniref:ABC transporter substrate-binding protein n=1 Tax=Fusobacterium sp. TaxID=68766 RepID=UPI0026DB47E3|nr:ABC transporter substrate-binding protein [Fusobacterium sp.]MDO4691154.1 ABC transporter substrate-binding protein [Fusobacterium sp.]
MKKLVLSLLFCLTTLALSNEVKVKIGITQIVEHPALDAAREGIQRAFKEKAGDKNIEVDYQSAQGDFGTAQLIAKNFVSSKKDLIVAISTPSAQAALNTTKTIPIVFTAVTDHISAGLKGNNITGTLDASPLKEQVELIKVLFPKAKKIGFIYNPSEQNSLVILKKFQEILEENNLTIVEKGVNSINDINLALNSLFKQIDVLYLPTDNLVSSAISLVNKKALDQKIPTIASEEELVKKGSLVSQSIDYEKLGYQTGERIIEILNGREIKDIKVEGLKENKLVVNKKTAEKLGISLEKTILKDAIKY